jgi:phosphonopyruvate decarboxylase
MRHVVFNNGAHESVGKQPTVAFQMDMQQIAMGCGYKKAYSVTGITELKQVLETFRDEDGTALLEIKVNLASRDDLGRPTRTTHENKEDFMNYLK